MGGVISVLLWGLADVWAVLRGTWRAKAARPKIIPISAALADLLNPAGLPNRLV
jgi:hypothetical protein